MTAAFLCSMTRTPFGRYGGALAGVRTDDLAGAADHGADGAPALLDWARVDEVILGCANQSGEDNRNVARMAALLAGLPDTVPAFTVNRLCASGLEAVGQAARAIVCGEAELVLAGGVESMSRAPYVMAKPDTASRANQAGRHDARLAHGQSAHAGTLRRRLDGADGRKPRSTSKA
jgi:acetyl-CoA acetyltransferase